MSNSYLSNSEPHCTVTIIESQKAWHILGILLSIGRPACPEELAAKCELFNASLDFVRYLCSVPNSPIYLMENGLVTLSMTAVSAFGEFAGIGGSISRFGITVLDSNRLWDSNVKMYCRKRKGVVLDELVLLEAKKRLSAPLENGERDGNLLALENGIQDAFDKEHVIMIRNMNLPTVTLHPIKVELGNLNEERTISPLLLGSNSEFSNFPTTNVEVEHREGENGVGIDIVMYKEIPGSVHTSKFHDSLFKTETNSNILKPIHEERVMPCLPDLNLALPVSNQDPLVCDEALISNMRFRNKPGYASTICLEEDTQQNVSQLEAGKYESHPCMVSMSQSKEDAETQMETNGREDCINYSTKGDLENLVPLDKSAVTGEAPMNCLESRNLVNTTTSDKDQTVRKVETQVTFPLVERSSTHKLLAKSSSKLKVLRKNALPPEPGVLVESLTYNKVVVTPKQKDQSKSGQKCKFMEHKLKQTRNRDMCAKENMIDTTSISPSNQLDKTALPNFESFIIEEEEGSGGYGTVYRARRKNDGKMFAIKCPHAKAPKHHVNNELKMLQHFGGRNFIIKFEGSFVSDNGDCFILEHVQHERPEVLKKDIDIYQLQWYGYCMFRALACLHKQGVVHRDVKPGNFLFSRKLNKGYLIDFNLAMDLQQKYIIGSKSKSSHNVSFDHVPLPHSKSAPSTKDNMLMRGNFIAANRGAFVDSRPIHEPNKNMKKRTVGGPLKNYPDVAGGNIFRSQGADGSGITSTKDVTSTRTPSTERRREPLPFLGRKELISLVQDAMKSPGHDAIISSASQRKRIAAPPSKVDRKTVYLSPMPLHCAGVAIAGSGLLKSTGDGKHKREGPCVGTKGFRAPEVLFRSLHQGPKVDVWSAGVTLLYLMVGRTPFTGDPEQNIKDIAKLKGSEDLWEVAKLHDCESSFPVELLDMQSLLSMDLQSWCKIHTKRPEFFKLIPRPLFDLVDKCLTVNPRLRISAEEALRHEFFSSCHESLRKQKMLRQGLSLDSASVQSDHLTHGQSQVSLDL